MRPHTLAARWRPTGACKHTMPTKRFALVQMSTKRFALVQMSTERFALVQMSTKRFALVQMSTKRFALVQMSLASVRGSMSAYLRATHHKQGHWSVLGQHSSRTSVQHTYPHSNHLHTQNLSMVKGHSRHRKWKMKHVNHAASLQYSN